MKDKPKIVTLGAAVFEAYLIGGAMAAKRDVKQHDYVEQFPLGAKIEVDKLVYGVGGGAANAAVTFARQGIATSLMTKIADDMAGEQVLKQLKSEGVNTNFVACDLEGMTGYSTILLAPNGERTILVYRGTAEELNVKDFDWDKLQADWLYVTSLGGNLELLGQALKIAQERHIQVALDAGSKELNQAEKLKALLPKLMLIKGNKQELAKLFGGSTATETIKAAAKICPFVVLTDGPNGSFVTDGTFIHELGLYKNVKVVDRTGAGDAFGAGFVAYLAQNKSIEEALTFADANATSVVQSIGAQSGILTANAKLTAALIKKRPL